MGPKACQILGASSLVEDLAENSGAYCEGQKGGKIGNLPSERGRWGLITRPVCSYQPVGNG